MCRYFTGSTGRRECYGTPHKFQAGDVVTPIDDYYGHKPVGAHYIVKEASFGSKGSNLMTLAKRNKTRYKAANFKLVHRKMDMDETEVDYKFLVLDKDSGYICARSPDFESAQQRVQTMLSQSPKKPIRFSISLLKEVFLPQLLFGLRFHSKGELL